MKSTLSKLEKRCFSVGLMFVCMVLRLGLHTSELISLVRYKKT